MKYIKGVISELKRVKWPTLSDINKYTWTVIMMVILFGLFFGGADLISNAVVNWLVSL